jgi:hypothetical protein
MTTVTKPRSRKRGQKNFLPPSADVANVAGRDFVIMPLDDFEEWFDDMLLMAVADERLQSKPLVTVPMEDVFARQAVKRRKGK